MCLGARCGGAQTPATPSALPPIPGPFGFEGFLCIWTGDFNLQTREWARRREPSSELLLAHPPEDKKKRSIEQPGKLVTGKMK